MHKLKNHFNFAVPVIIISLGLIGLLGAGMIFSYPAYADDTENNNALEAEEEQKNDFDDINFYKYESDDFTIHYPDDWELQTEEDQHGKIVIFSKVLGGYPNMNIIQEWDVEMSLSEYIDFNLEELQDFEGFELKTNEEAKLDSVNARMLEYIHDEMYTTLRQRQFLTVHEGDAYVLTYTDMAGNFSDDINLFNHIVENKFEFESGE